VRPATGAAQPAARRGVILAVRRREPGPFTCQLTMNRPDPPICPGQRLSSGVTADLLSGAARPPWLDATRRSCGPPQATIRQGSRSRGPGIGPRSVTSRCGPGCAKSRRPGRFWRL